MMSEETRDKINCYSYVWFKTTKKDTIDIYGYRFDVKIIEFKYINFKNYIK